MALLHVGLMWSASLLDTHACAQRAEGAIPAGIDLKPIMRIDHWLGLPQTYWEVVPKAFYKDDR